MSEEDKEFLQKAMQDAMKLIENPNEIMMEAIKVVTAEDRTEQTIITGLEVLDTCCDDPDCARNIEKLGGLQPLLDLLGTHPGAIRVRTLEILALMFSNNPNIQEAGMKRGAMATFLGLTRDCEKGTDERAKAFRALVAVVRNMETSEAALVKENNGVEVIISFLNVEEEARTREKAASFARSLAENERISTDEAVLLANAIVPLVDRLSTEPGMQYREVVAECACHLAKALLKKCPGDLAAAVDKRKGEIKISNDQDCENELVALLQFEANLRDCATDEIQNDSLQSAPPTHSPTAF